MPTNSVSSSSNQQTTIADNVYTSPYVDSCLPDIEETVSTQNPAATWDFSGNPVYSGLVTDLELATFSALAYRSHSQHDNAIASQSDDNRLQRWPALYAHGWRVLRSIIGKDGFRALAYVHEARKQVVIAFRGTETEELVTLWVDWDEVVNKAIGSHGKQAYAFTEEVIKQGLPLMSQGDFNLEAYQLTFTGHSLGAWIASIAGSTFSYPAVVFDNPGARDVIEKYRKGQVGEQLVDTQLFALTNYQSRPNLINTASMQLGYTLELTTRAPARAHNITDIQAEAKYTLAQHSIDLIIDTFDPKTGMPYQDQVKQVKTWPHGGIEAAKKLVSLLPSELQNAAHLLCRWWFLDNVSYTDWIGLIGQLVASSPAKLLEVPKLAMITYQTFSQAYTTILSHDYFKGGQYEEPQSYEAAFQQRFKSHYHVIEFDTQSLPAILFHDSLLRFLVDVVRLRRLSGKKFSISYDYLNQVKLIEKAHDLAIKGINLDKSTGMTAIDLRREVMQSLPKLSEQYSYLVNSPTRSDSQRPQKLSYGVPTQSHESHVIPRTGLISDLKNQFSQASKSIAKIQAIYGLGGMGKTQLAIQLAKEAHDKGDYEAVIWLAAGDDLHAAYQSFAYTQLGNQVDTLTPKTCLTRTMHTLSERYKSILFIFDNVESVSEVKAYLDELPHVEKMDVLITTRSQQIASYYDKFEMKKFTSQEALQYITLSLKQESDRTIFEYFKSILSKQENATAILELAELVDFHPLSLSYLVAYIKSEYISVKECIKQYKAQKIDPINIMKDNINAKQGKAILLSLDKLSNAAKQLLNACAFLAADDIPKTLLEDYFKKEDAGLAVKVTSAAKELKQYSFVNDYHLEIDGSTHLYIHRLLQDMVRYRLKEHPKVLNGLAERLLLFFNQKIESHGDIIASTFEEKKEKLNRDFSHVQSLCENIESKTLNSDAQANHDKLLIWISRYSYAQAGASRLMGDYQSAIDSYKDIIKRNPGNVWSYHYLGECYRKLEQYENAEVAYTQAIEVDSNEWQHYRYRGDTYRLMKDHEKAIKDYQTAIDSKPKKNLQKAWNCHYIGFCQYELGEYENAITAYKEAIRLNPGEQSHYHYLGNVYRKQAILAQKSKNEKPYYHKAITQYEIAIEKNNKKPWSHHYLGECYRKLEQYENAEVAYTQAIEVDSNEWQHYRYRGDTYRLMKDHEKAIKDYQTAIDSKPEKNLQKAWNCHYIGFCQYELGEYENAITAYKEAIRLNPGEQSHYHYLGNVYRKQAILAQKSKNEKPYYHKAITQYEIAIEKNNKKPWSHHYLGECYRKLEQYENAEVAYTQAIEVDSNEWQHYRYRGDTYRLMKDHEKAIKDYQTAIDSKPEKNLQKAWNCHYIGFCQYELGEYENAITAYKEAIELNPEGRDHHHYLGNVYRKQGNIEKDDYQKRDYYQKAVEQYNVAIQLNPDSNTSKRYLKECQEQLKQISNSWDPLKFPSASAASFLIDLPNEVDDELEQPILMTSAGTRLQPTIVVYAKTLNCLINQPWHWAVALWQEDWAGYLSVEKPVSTLCNIGEIDSKAVTQSETQTHNHALVPVSEIASTANQEEMAENEGLSCDIVFFNGGGDVSPIPALVCRDNDTKSYTFAKGTAETALSTTANTDSPQSANVQGDIYYLSECRAVSFYGEPALYCEGEQTTIVSKPVQALPRVVEQATDLFMLGIIGRQISKDVCSWLNSVYQNWGKTISIEEYEQQQQQLIQTKTTHQQLNAQLLILKKTMQPADYRCLRFEYEELWFDIEDWETALSYHEVIESDKIVEMDDRLSALTKEISMANCFADDKLLETPEASEYVHGEPTASTGDMVTLQYGALFAQSLSSSSRTAEIVSPPPLLIETIQPPTPQSY